MEFKKFWRLGLIFGVLLFGILSAYFVYANGITLSNTDIEYKNKNMTIEFKENGTIIGEATLKSHKTYDETLRVTSGENKIVIWYEFSNFKENKLNTLDGVDFIDMRKYIENKTYTSQFKDYELMNESLIIIPNPNYLNSISKDYQLVYRNEKGEWINYTSKDIPTEKIIIGVQTDMAWGEFLDVQLNVLGNKLDKHALVLGTSCGFVTETPSGDPDGSNTGTIDGRALAFRDTSPADADRVTEIGWWDNTGDAPAINFEVAIYADEGDGTTPSGSPIGSSQINPKGDSIGWKNATGLNIDIEPNTIYWIVVQLDSTPDNTLTDVQIGINRLAIKGSQTTLPDPWGASESEYDNAFAFYAVYEATAGDSCTCAGLGNNWEINLSDYCVVSEYCDLGFGNITFTDTGNITFYANITACNIGMLPDNQIGYFNNSVEISEGGSC